MEELNGGRLTHDLKSILTTHERSFLIRSNGDLVRIDEILKKKTVALYFSAQWCGPCRRFTPTLAMAYDGVVGSGDDLLEVVFVSSDEDEIAFYDYFAEMPWLAVPFRDRETRDRRKDLFEAQGIPRLAVLDGASGGVLNPNGVRIVAEHGGDAYPFTLEKVRRMEEEKEKQTIHSVLTSPSRDYIIRNNGSEVPVAELEGKMVGIYFSGSHFERCGWFHPVLAKMYSELKEKGEPFEVVLASLDDEEKDFREAFQGMPWLSLPFMDLTVEKLQNYFGLRAMPTLVIIGPDGKTLNANAADLVYDHGVEAYPFSPEKVEKLSELEKAKQEAQTLESLLVTDGIDFVTDKNGSKVPVDQLVGKTVLFYFSARMCPPCRAFTPKLVDTYHKIKAQQSHFEVIFVSSDRDESSYEEYYSEMPWLTIPHEDARRKSLRQAFKVQSIPTLAAVGPSGKTLTRAARLLVTTHGPEAYPFTEERVKELKAEMGETAKGWPDSVKHRLHGHELVKTRSFAAYVCDRCEADGDWWSFCCDQCEFRMHPACALADGEGDVLGKKAKAEEEKGEMMQGYVCEGGVCRKV